MTKYMKPKNARRFVRVNNTLWVEADATKSDAVVVTEFLQRLRLAKSVAVEPKPQEHNTVLG
jgi:hypothetical protein